jgi:hypothetical protein
MSGFDKLKSRTEWQAFLVMILTTFAAFFFGIDMEPEKFERLFDMLGLAWGGTASYAVSRGIGKAGKSGDAPSAPAPAAEEDQPAPAAEEDQPGADSDADS